MVSNETPILQPRRINPAPPKKQNDKIKLATNSNEMRNCDKCKGVLCFLSEHEKQKFNKRCHALKLSQAQKLLLILRPESVSTVEFELGS